MDYDGPLFLQQSSMEGEPQRDLFLLNLHSISSQDVKIPKGLPNKGSWDAVKAE